MIRTRQEIIASILKANGGERRPEYINFIKDEKTGLPIVHNIIDEIESIEYDRFEFPHTKNKRNPEPVPEFIFVSNNFTAKSSDGQRLSFPVERAVKDEIASKGSVFRNRMPSGEFEAWLAVKIIMSGWYIQKMDSFFPEIHKIRGGAVFEAALKIARKETAKTLVLNLFSTYHDVITEEDIIDFFREAEIDYVMDA